MSQKKIRRKSYHSRRNRRHKPSFKQSQKTLFPRNLFRWIHPLIFKGILLLITGIIVIRLSPKFFGFKEITFWSLLVGGGLFIGGILTLIAWWRNNVSMFTSRHSIKWN